MTREEEFEAALEARARAEEAARLRTHARFLASHDRELNKAARRVITLDQRHGRKAVA